MSQDHSSLKNPPLSIHLPPTVVPFLCLSSQQNFSICLYSTILALILYSLLICLILFLHSIETDSIKVTSVIHTAKCNGHVSIFILFTLLATLNTHNYSFFVDIRIPQSLHFSLTSLLFLSPLTSPPPPLSNNRVLVYSSDQSGSSSPFSFHFLESSFSFITLILSSDGSPNYIMILALL